MADGHQPGKRQRTEGFLPMALASAVGFGLSSRADAQVEGGLILVESLEGVASVSRLADGALSIVMATGETIVVPATAVAEVGGALAIAEATAASLGLQAAAGAAVATGGLTAGTVALGAGGAIAGAAVVEEVADDGDDTPPAETPDAEAPSNAVPQITSPADVSVAEGIEAGDPVHTLTATDADGDTLSYALTGEDADAFTLDPDTGVLTFVETPDHEDPADADGDNVYNITVTVDDGQGTTEGTTEGTPASQDLTVTVTDVDEAPELTVTQIVTSVAENTPSAVIARVEASDPEGADLEVTLSDTDNFAYDAQTGVITLVTAQDHETTASLPLTVTVSDGVNPDVTRSLIVTVTNVDEAPALTVTQTETVTSVAENSAATVIATVSVSDPEGDSLTVTLSDTDNFAYDADTGVITLRADRNYEALTANGGSNALALTVSVSDGTNTASQNLTVTVTDVDEAPAFTGTEVSVDVAEGTTTVGYTPSVTDPEGADLTYSLTGDDAGLFSVDTSTGAITFNTAPDFEVPGNSNSNSNNAYLLTVTVSDGTNTASQNLTVNVTNVDEAPAFTGTEVTAVVGDGPLYTAVATDPEGGTVTYSLDTAAVDEDHALLAIDASTGAVTLQPGADLTGKTQLDFTVIATDGANLSATQTVTLKGANLTVGSGGTANGTILGDTFTVSDAGFTSIDGGDGTDTVILEVQGAISVAQLSGIETVDLSDEGQQTLVVESLEDLVASVGNDGTLNVVASESGDLLQLGIGFDFTTDSGTRTVTYSADTDLDGTDETASINLDANIGIFLGGTSDPDYFALDAELLAFIDGIHGFDGLDTVQLAGDLTTLDLTATGAPTLISIEAFDLATDTGAQTLKIMVSDVTHLVGANGTLTIDGSAGDTLVLTGLAVGAGSVPMGPDDGYLLYNLGQNQGTLRVKQDVTVQAEGLTYTVDTATEYTGTFGNDTFNVSVTDFTSIDGGDGTDTVVLTGMEFELDLRTSVTLTSIEVFDLSEFEEQTLTLSVADVTGLVGAGGTLTVTGTVDDGVTVIIDSTVTGTSGTAGAVGTADEGFTLYDLGGGPTLRVSGFDADDVTFVGASFTVGSGGTANGTILGDTFNVSDAGFTSITGGAGTDTVVLEVDLDLTAEGAPTVTSIEAFDLSAAGAQTLTLDATALSALVGAGGTLYVTPGSLNGSSGDTLAGLADILTIANTPSSEEDLDGDGTNELYLVFDADLGADALGNRTTATVKVRQGTIVEGFGIARFGTNNGEQVNGSGSLQDVILGLGGNDDLRDTGGGDSIFFGGDGDDFIAAENVGGQAYGGAGNDSIRIGFVDTNSDQVNDLVYTKLDGGAGDDFLILNNASIDLDSLVDAGVVSNFEVLSLTRIDATLAIDTDFVADMTDSGNTLTVIGEAADTVTLSSAFSSTETRVDETFEWQGSTWSGDVTDYTATVGEVTYTVRIAEVIYTTIENLAPELTVTQTATSVAENSADTEIATVSVSDPEGDPLTVTLSDTDNFAYDAQTGVITLVTAQDHETTASLPLTVTVSDGTNTASQNLTVTVTDVNEAPAFEDPNVFAVAGSSMLFSSQAEDPEGGTVTYSLATGQDNDLLVIDASTGAVTLAGGADLTGKTQLVFTIIATDAGELSGAQTVTLTGENLTVGSGGTVTGTFLGDTFNVSVTDFTSITGGTGTDTVVLEVDLDLTAEGAPTLTSIEAFDLATDTGAQTLTLSVADVTDLVGAGGTLTIDGTVDDRLVVVGDAVQGTDGTGDDAGFTLYELGGGPTLRVSEALVPFFSDVATGGSLTGGAEDDTFTVGVADFTSITGSDGTDTVVLAVDLDLTAEGAPTVTSIEAFDLATDTGAQTLTLTSDQALDLAWDHDSDDSTPPRFTLNANAGDALDLLSSGTGDEVWIIDRTAVDSDELVAFTNFNDSAKSFSVLVTGGMANTVASQLTWRSGAAATSSGVLFQDGPDIVSVDFGATDGTRILFLQKFTNPNPGTFDLADAFANGEVSWANFSEIRTLSISSLILSVEDLRTLSPDNGVEFGINAGNRLTVIIDESVTTLDGTQTAGRTVFDLGTGQTLFSVQTARVEAGDVTFLGASVTVGSSDTANGTILDDTFTVGVSDFDTINGGNGTDTVVLTGADFVLDLSSSGTLSNIEAFDLATDTGAQTLNTTYALLTDDTDLEAQTINPISNELDITNIAVNSARDYRLITIDGGANDTFNIDEITDSYVDADGKLYIYEDADGDSYYYISGNISLEDGLPNVEILVSTDIISDLGDFQSL